MTNIKCDICFRSCTVAEGRTGFCNARANIDGVNTPLSYGRFLSISLDLIEKKPLFYYKPGTSVLSFGTFGCNLTCQFCQNHTLARAKANDYKSEYISPELAVRLAKKYEEMSNIGIAFTYNEPMINFEYIRDTGKLLKENGMDLVLVTNGSINEKYLKGLLPYVDAFNIDLKTFSEEKYRYLGGDLKTVQNAIRLASTSSHVEITTLIVPGISDDKQEFRAEVDFLAEIDPDIPLHITRYFPNYKYNKPPTDIGLMEEFRQIALEKLNRVILGNV